MYGFRRKCPRVFGSVSDDEVRSLNVDIHKVKSFDVGHSRGNLMVL